MRSTLFISLSLVPSIAFAAAQEGDKPTLLSPSGGLMLWTVLIFVVLMFILSRFAFKPLIAAVEAREASLEAAIAGAKQDRDEAARLLDEQRQQLEAARAEAQRFIVEGRVMGEKLKASMLEETKAQQNEMLERARRELENEKTRAISQLRLEAIDLALAGAGKVIGRNLDDAANRKLIEDFLASIPKTTRVR
ncbi:MAG: F0F1 ATP synthase subunit B [Gemmatimonadaceae bacterium]